MNTPNQTSSRCSSALPNFDEVPSLPSGWSRHDDSLLRLGLIPHDDRDLREAAVALFVAEEHQANDLSPDVSPEVKSAELLDKLQDALGDISSAHAHTPGGIAWKIAEALSFFNDEAEWLWWRHLLHSAVIDAIELERARQKG
jgi:hypothetical protein